MCRDEGEVQFFVAMNNTGDPVDVWAIDEVDEAELLEAREGFVYLRGPIPPRRLTLVRRDQLPEAIQTGTASAAYASTLTITLDDGTVLRDEDARDWDQRALNDHA